MTAHGEQHPRARQTVHVDLGNGPEKFVVEDWWDQLTGESWMFSVGNPACLKYAVRSGAAGLPLDNEVVYGRTDDGLGHLVHETEISPT